MTVLTMWDGSISRTVNGMAGIENFVAIVSRAEISGQYLNPLSANVH